MHCRDDAIVRRERSIVVKIQSQIVFGKVFDLVAQEVDGPAIERVLEVSEGFCQGFFLDSAEVVIDIVGMRHVDSSRI